MRRGTIVILAQSYTPFGEPLWSAGSGTTTYGFTGEQWEAYTGLLFLRARYYEPGTGRFVTWDRWPGNQLRPATYNAFVYALNNPANIIDLTGMVPTEASVKRGDHSFSCRCGWIDWGHAGPRTARAIKNAIQCELELDLGSPDYKVIDTGSPFPLTGGLAVVSRHLSEEEQKRAALGIFMSLEQEVEELQSAIGKLTLGAMKSGWAMEDLPSDLISFYVAWETKEGISVEQLKEMVGSERHPPCYVLNVEDSLDVFHVFDESGLLDEKNPHWAALPIPGSCPDVVGKIAEKCHGIPLGWPEQYARVMPEPERTGGNWWLWEGLGTGEQVQRACCQPPHEDIGNVFYYFPCSPCGSVP